MQTSVKQSLRGPSVKLLTKRSDIIISGTCQLEIQLVSIAIPQRLTLSFVIELYSAEELAQIREREAENNYSSLIAERVERNERIGNAEPTRSLDVGQEEQTGLTP